MGSKRSGRELQKSPCKKPVDNGVKEKEKWTGCVFLKVEYLSPGRGG